MKRISCANFVLFILLFNLGAAYAQNNNDNKFNFASNLYASLSFGQSKFDLFESPQAVKIDQTDNSFGFNFGYQLIEHFGVELSYHQFGEAVSEYGFNNQSEILEINGLSFGGTVALPVSEKFVVGAKAGVMSWDIEHTLKNASSTNTAIYSGDDSFWGVTFRYKFNDNTSVNLGHFVYEMKHSDFVKNPRVTDLNISLTFRFQN